MEKIACMILCGGESKRMGQNKALLPFKGSTLLEYQYHRLLECALFADVFLSCKKPFVWHNINQEKYVFDQSALFTPLNALASILQASCYVKNFIITVDAPFVPIQLIKVLLEYPSDSHVIVFQDRFKTHPLIGIYHKNAYKGIQSMLHQGVYRLNHLKDFVRFETIFHDKEKDFTNLNTPDDYKQALKQGMIYG